MRSPVIRIIAACLALLTVSTIARSQSFSTFQLSGRADRLAMGDLSFLRPELGTQRVEAEVNYGRWLPGIMTCSMLQAGAFVSTGDNFGIRLDYRNNFFPEFSGFDDDGNPYDSGKTSEQRILAGVSFAVGEGLQFDLNGKYLIGVLAGEKGFAVAGDLAFRYSRGAWTFGIKGSDIGSKYSFGESAWSLPARVEAGGSYGLVFAERHGLTLGADAGYIFPQGYRAFTAAAGAEYSFNRMIFARAGYRYATSVAPRFASFGLGLTLKGFSLDATLLLLPTGHAWTAGLRFSL